MTDPVKVTGWVPRLVVPSPKPVPSETNWIWTFPLIAPAVAPGVNVTTIVVFAGAPAARPVTAPLVP